MFWGLFLACCAAFFGCSRILFVSQFAWTDPRIAAITACIVVAWGLRYGKSDKALNRLVLLYGLCMIPGVVSSYFAGTYRLSLAGIPGTYSGSVWTAALCASGLLLAARLTPEDKGKLSGAVWIMGTITALHCVLQWLGNDPFRIGPLPDGNRAVALFGSPIDAGAILVACAMVSLNPLYLIGMFATVSRGALLAASVGLFPVKWRPLAALLCISVGMGYVFTSDRPKDITRVETWKTAASAMTLAGNGPCTFMAEMRQHRTPKLVKEFPGYNQAFAHNAILEALCSLGLMGLLGLAVFLYFPRFAGMWVISMFNPISFEVTFVACVLAGIHYVPREGLFKWEA